MFGLGMPEILLILAIALIVIGPKKLPELAKTLGRAMGEFKRSAQELKRSIDIETTVNDTPVKAKDTPVKEVKDIEPPAGTDLKEAVKEANQKKTPASAETTPDASFSAADPDTGSDSGTQAKE